MAKRRKKSTRGDARQDSESVSSVSTHHLSQCSSQSSVLSMDEWSAAHQAIERCVILSSNCNELGVLQDFATNLVEEHYPYNGDYVLLAMFVKFGSAEKMTDVLENLNTNNVEEMELTTEAGIIQLLVYEWHKGASVIVRCDGTRTARSGFGCCTNFLKLLDYYEEEAGVLVDMRGSMKAAMLYRNGSFEETEHDVFALTIAISDGFIRMNEAKSKRANEDLISTIKELNESVSKANGRSSLSAEQKGLLRWCLENAAWLPTAVDTEQVKLQDIEKNAPEIQIDMKYVIEIRKSIEAKRLTQKPELQKFVLLSVQDPNTGKRRLLPIGCGHEVEAHRQIENDPECVFDCAILQYHEGVDVEEMIGRACVQTHRKHKGRKGKLNEHEMMGTYRKFFASVTPDGSLSNLLSCLSGRELNSILQAEDWDKSYGDLVLAATFGDELYDVIREFSQACARMVKKPFQIHTDCWITTISNAIKTGRGTEETIAEQIRVILAECRSGTRIMSKRDMVKELIGPLRDNSNAHRRSTQAVKRKREEKEISNIMSFFGGQKRENLPIESSVDDPFGDAGQPGPSTNTTSLSHDLQPSTTQCSMLMSPIASTSRFSVGVPSNATRSKTWTRSESKSPGFCRLSGGNNQSPHISHNSTHSDNADELDGSEQVSVACDDVETTRARCSPLKKRMRPATPLLTSGSAARIVNSEATVIKKIESSKLSKTPAKRTYDGDGQEHPDIGNDFIVVRENKGGEFRSDVSGVYIVKMESAVWAYAELAEIAVKAERSGIGNKDIRLVIIGEIDDLELYAIVPHNTDVDGMANIYPTMKNLIEFLKQARLGLHMSAGTEYSDSEE